jgi:hypothetical protein
VEVEHGDKGDKDMPQSKSKRKNRDTTLLDEIRKLRGEIKNNNVKVSAAIERLQGEINQNKVLQVLNDLRNEIRRENLSSSFRDIGAIILAIAAAQITFAFSFAQLGLSDLYVRAIKAGIFFAIAGLSLVLQSAWIKIPACPIEGRRQRLFYALINFPLAWIGLAIGIVVFMVLIF